MAQLDKDGSACECIPCNNSSNQHDRVDSIVFSVVSVSRPCCDAKEGQRYEEDAVAG